MKLLSKLLITLAILSYGAVPLIADLNPTHLFHPDWTPHARLHAAWLLASCSAIALVALYVTWIKEQVQLGGVLSICVLGGFWIAALSRGLYGGSLTDTGGVEVTVLGFEANSFAFTVTFMMAVAGMLLNRLSKP
jgi:Family of unknown function (DUF6640)